MQPSVIARLEAVSGGASDIIITGSHLDTIACKFDGCIKQLDGSNHAEPNANPAADDCASGSTVVFETLRILVQKGFVPFRPLEFHWYAAEEEGIYGSGAVADAYAKQGVNVMSYLNLDQSGYVKPGTKPTIALLTDHATTDSTDFLRKVANVYGTQVVSDTKYDLSIF